MSDQDSSLVTQGAEGQQQETTSPSGAAAGSQQEEYFLNVDERHRYKTQDDAIKAIKESGEHIGRLTPWQEHAQRYGVTDPSALPQIFDQYLEMRDKLKALEAQVAKNDQGSASGGTSKLNPQDEANVKYLETHGFTRKDAIDKVLTEKLSPLEQKVAHLESLLGQSQDNQTQAVIESGREHLAGLMEDAGMPIDKPEINEVIEDSIVAWMEGQSLDRKGNIVPGSPLDKFYQGGAAMREVVQQGFERVTKVFNSSRQTSDGQYQQRNQQTVARTPKALPRGERPAPKSNEEQQQQRPRTPGSGGVNAGLHDKAWEIMKEVNEGRR